MDGSRARQQSARGATPTHSGKAKKNRLKLQREGEAERRARREALAASPEKLGDLSDKAVRAHVFVDSLEHGQRAVARHHATRAVVHVVAKPRDT